MSNLFIGLLWTYKHTWTGFYGGQLRIRIYRKICGLAKMSSCIMAWIS